MHTCAGKSRRCGPRPKYPPGAPVGDAQVEPDRAERCIVLPSHGGAVELEQQRGARAGSNPSGGNRYPACKRRNYIQLCGGRAWCRHAWVVMHGAAMSAGIGAGMCRQEKGMARWQGKLRRDSGRRGVGRTFGCRCLVPNQATHHRGPKTCGAIGSLCGASGDY